MNLLLKKKFIVSPVNRRDFKRITIGLEIINNSLFKDLKLNKNKIKVITFCTK